MIPSLVFVWGFVGSLAVAIVNVILAYDQRQLPRRYIKVSYWFLRFLLAVIAGLVALAFDVEKPIHAFSIGVAAPLIIRRLEHQPKLPSSPR